VNFLKSRVWKEVVEGSTKYLYLAAYDKLREDEVVCQNRLNLFSSFARIQACDR